MIFEHLLARQTHRHEAAPDAVFVTGWDVRWQISVCWAVDKDVSFQQAIILAKCAGQIADRLDNKHEWLLGIAAVSLIWYPGERHIATKHIDVADYAALAAEAT